MTAVLSIDPGYAKRGNGNALALTLDGHLIDTWYERSCTDRAGSHTSVLEAVVIEQPQQDGRSWAVPPAVLIKLAWEGMRLAGTYAGLYQARLYDPTVNEWKGSEAKSVQHARMWAGLTAAERAVLGGDATWRQIEAAREKGALKRWAPHPTAYYPAKFLTHNLLDAVCLNKWHLGVLPKVG